MAVTTAQRLAYLGRLRDNLAENLSVMGVEASRTETLGSLVPKVLEILIGDQTVPLFDFTLLKDEIKSSIAPTDYAESTEVLSFGGCASVARCNLITQIDLVFTAQEPITLRVAGEGWSSVAGSSGNEAIARYSMTRATAAKANAALSALSFTIEGSGPVNIVVKGYYGQQIFTALGERQKVKAVVSDTNSWMVLEKACPTWNDLEGRTWEQIEALRKADIAA